MAAWAGRYGLALAALSATTCVALHDQGKPRSSRSFPLVVVRDVPLPGAANRFDYQEVDADGRRLYVAHMSDDALVVLNLDDGAVLKVLPHLQTPRGIALGANAGRLFVTTAPSQLVIIDLKTLTELARVTTGKSPDGVAYDAQDRIVGVSDQADGALSLLADAGGGARRQVPLGSETGNVVFDAARGSFWITVIANGAPDRLVQVGAISGAVANTLDLPGCRGAHGLRLHPNGQSAFVACEDNSVLLRVALAGAAPITRASVGQGPDVLSIDPGLNWLYVAAESGTLVVFDLDRLGLVALDREHVGERAHSVAVDPFSHRLFFPLQVGPNGGPVLRIARPR